MIGVLLCTLFVVSASAEDRDDNGVETSAKPSNVSPKFLANPATFVAVPAGANLNLNCKASGTPNPDIHWEKDGKEQTLAKTPSRKLSNKGRKFVLRRRNVTTRDSGSYRCVVSNSRGRIERNFTVTIITRDKSPPHIDYITSNQTVNEGVTVSLSCHVTSDLTPSIAWIKHCTTEYANVRDNQTSVLKKSDLEGNTRILKLENVVPSDSAQYTCVAKTQFGESSRSTWLVVSPISKASMDETRARP